jgi:hypothetical protein
MRLIALAAMLCLSGLALAAPPTTRPALSAMSPGKHPVIVHVVSRDETVSISSSPKGLTYSLGKPDGQVTIADATGPELEKLNPQLYQFIRSCIVVKNDDAPVSWAGCD